MCAQECVRLTDQQDSSSDVLRVNVLHSRLDIHINCY
jgi:hypothetical protein